MFVNFYDFIQYIAIILDIFTYSFHFIIIDYARITFHYAHFMHNDIHESSITFYTVEPL